MHIFHNIWTFYFLNLKNFGEKLDLHGGKISQCFIFLIEIIKSDSKITKTVKQSYLYFYILLMKCSFEQSNQQIILGEKHQFPQKY